MLPGLTPRTCTVPLLQFLLHPINQSSIPSTKSWQWRHSSLAAHTRSLSSSSFIIRFKPNRAKKKPERRRPLWGCHPAHPSGACGGALSAEEGGFWPCLPHQSHLRPSLSLLSFMGYSGEGSSFRGPTGGACWCPTSVSTVSRQASPFPLKQIKKGPCACQKHRKRKRKRRGKQRCTVNIKPSQEIHTTLSGLCGVFRFLYITPFISKYLLYLIFISTLIIHVIQKIKVIKN
jgi:hypothetical protein